jgi:putative membrane protein
VLAAALMTFAVMLEAHGQGTTQVSSADRKFIEKAAGDGMAEVELGKLAQQKGTHPRVKEFGNRMATDHAKANDELKQLAAAKGVTLPSALDKKHQKDIDELAKSRKFDHEYMEMMVKDHRKDVSEFRKQAKSAKDDGVRAFAAKTLPTLEEHLQLAQDTRKAAGATGGAAFTGSTAGNTGGDLGGAKPAPPNPPKK